MRHDGERNPNRQSDAGQKAGVRIALVLGAAIGALIVGTAMTWGQSASAFAISGLVAASLAGVGIGLLIKARQDQGKAN